MLSIFDQAWSAQHFQDAGAQAAAAELAWRTLHPRNGKYRDHCKRAASVLLKADRAAAVPQLVSWAAQNPESVWLAGVMDAFDDTDPEVERAGAFCARELVAHPRVDGKDFVTRSVFCCAVRASRRSILWQKQPGCVPN
jgi:hypothetical protein